MNFVINAKLTKIIIIIIIKCIAHMINDTTMARLEVFFSTPGNAQRVEGDSEVSWHLRSEEGPVVEKLVDDVG